MVNPEWFNAQDIQFIDHHAVDWTTVRRTRSLFYQRFQYEYPGPIRDLKQRLVVVPGDQYGSQRLHHHTLTVNPLPVKTRQIADDFGNRILEVEICEAEQVVLFEMSMIVESDGYAEQRPSIAAADIGYLLEPTRLTLPDGRIKAIAHELQQESQSPHELAQGINDWVYATMRYASGVTTVETTASEALALGGGLCQDYAHIMLSLCRVAGLPARYVSGHLLGEWGSHAWVEVILPTQDGLRAVAFDPTNDQQPHLGYTTVAVGRDYHDVSPTSGSFTAPYGGQLTCNKRAGLILVEYLNGDVVHSQPVQ